MTRRLHEYAFDIKLTGAIRVRATSANMARKILRDELDCADSNLGAWPDGSPILANLSMTGRPVLYETDGEPT